MKLFVFALMFTLLTIIQNDDPIMATEGGEVGMFALAFWLILLNEHKQQLTQWFNQLKSNISQAVNWTAPTLINLSGITYR